MSVSKKDLTPSLKIKNQEIIKRGEELITVLQKRASDLNLEINDYDIDNIVKLITAKAKNRAVSFSEFAEKWIEQCEKKGVRNYKTALNSFYAFFGKKNVLFADITVNTLKDFELYLSEKPRAKSLYINSLIKIFDDGRDFYNDEDNGVVLIKHNLKKYDAPKQNISAKRALPLEKIIEIINLPYKNELTVRGNICVRDLAKDCFVLSFFLMGMNTADLYNATDYDGEYITYQRTKTKDRRADRAEISVKVHPFIADIVQKYRGDKGRVFDFCKRYATEARLNRYVNLGLKEIGKEIGVDNLQFYAARHTVIIEQLHASATNFCAPTFKIIGLRFGIFVVFSYLCITTP